MTGLRLAPRLHHIGVQTFDLANSIAWYRDFFGCEPVWTLDTFSDLTRSRLPGIVQLTETSVGGLRFHLFARERNGGPLADLAVQFQHLCLSVASPAELSLWRNRWDALYESGRYAFLRPDQPTEIVVDADGVRSFYCFDVNGLEFEFTHVPGTDDDE